MGLFQTKELNLELLLLMVGLDIKELQYNLRLMNKIKQFILKNKYDILTILCSGLTYFVNVWFVLGIIVFLVIGESKK